VQRMSQMNNKSKQLYSSMVDLKEGHNQRTLSIGDSNQPLKYFWTALSKKKTATSSRRNLLSPRGPMRYAFNILRSLQRLTVLECTPRRRATSPVVSIVLIRS